MTKLTTWNLGHLYLPNFPRITQKLLNNGLPNDRDLGFIVKAMEEELPDIALFQELPNSSFLDKIANKLPRGYKRIMGPSYNFNEGNNNYAGYLGFLIGEEMPTSDIYKPNEQAAGIDIASRLGDIRVSNYHGDCYHPDVRERQIEKILEYQDKAKKSIMAGDFNIRNRFHTRKTKEHDSRILKKIKDSGLEELSRHINKSSIFQVKTDRIFANQGTDAECHADYNKRAGFMDHYPLIADIKNIPDKKK